MCERMLAHFVKTGHSFGNCVKLHSERKPRLVVGSLGVHFILVVKAAHAHHEEFVEIGSKDGEEFTPFQYWRIFIRRLLQHAQIEFEPRKFAVYVYALD